MKTAKPNFIRLSILICFIFWIGNVCLAQTVQLLHFDVCKKYVNQIDSNNIHQWVAYLAADSLEGRSAGKPGQRKAGKWIAKQMESFGLKKKIKVIKDSTYFQSLKGYAFQSENVVGFLPGYDSLAKEYIVLCAHYDHLGIRNGKIHNGADDNASGTSALLETARLFSQAYQDSQIPRRSIIFLATTAEEIGLLGSGYFVKNSPVPLKQIIANLNIDMLGRYDNKHLKKQETNYIYIIGANRLSKELHLINETANDSASHLSLDYSYNEWNDPEKLYYRSDHYHFAKNNIPCIFYFGGFHPDYHQPEDDTEKLDYSRIATATKLIFTTAWQLVHKAQRLKMNK